jgi:hypothetical protein
MAALLFECLPRLLHRSLFDLITALCRCEHGQVAPQETRRAGSTVPPSPIFSCVPFGSDEEMAASEAAAHAVLRANNPAVNMTISVWLPTAGPSHLTAHHQPFTQPTGPLRFGVVFAPSIVCLLFVGRTGFGSNVLVTR